MLAKHYIIRLAKQAISQNGCVTQFDIHKLFSEKFGRELTVGEKRKITYTLREFLPVSKVDFRKVTYGNSKSERVRVYYFGNS